MFELKESHFDKYFFVFTKLKHQKITNIKQKERTTTAKIQKTVKVEFYTCFVCLILKSVILNE